MQLRGRFDFTGAKDTPQVVPAGFQLETQARQFRVCSLSNTEKKTRSKFIALRSGGK